MLQKILTVAKAIAATVVPLVATSLVSGQFDWKNIVVAALTALAVYLVPNVKVAAPKQVAK